jgi:hypothetical protein
MTDGIAWGSAADSDSDMALDQQLEFRTFWAYEALTTGENRFVGTRSECHT